MKILRKKDLIGQIGIFLLGFCGSLYVAITPANSMMNWYNIDDAFYYYKVAQNVLTGHGFTFDQINLTNGFHPLWMVICLGVFWLSRYNLLLPLRALILVSGVLNGLTGVILFRLLKKVLHPTAAVLGSVVWMLLPSVFNTTTVHGMEAAISSLFLVLFLAQCVDLLQKGEANPYRTVRLLTAGLLAALAILSRLDNLFVVFVIGLFMILRIHRINRMLVFDLVGIMLAAIFAWVIRFGTASITINTYSVYPLLLIGLFIIPLVLFFCGFYSPAIKNRLGSFILRLGIAAVLSLVLEYAFLRLLQLLGFNLLLSRSVIALHISISLSLIAIIRIFYNPRQNALNSPTSPWQIFRNWLSQDLRKVILEGLTFGAPVALIISAYMAINRIFFGSYTPVSGQIKLWWGTLANTVYSKQNTLVDLLGLSPNSSRGPWSILTSPIAKVTIFIQKVFNPAKDDFPTLLFLILTFLIFILLVFMLSRKNGYLARKSFILLIPAMILGSFLQITFYTARGYTHTRFWYWVTESLVLVILGAIFSSRLFEKVKEWTKSEVSNHVLLMLGIIYLLFIHTRYVTNLAPQNVNLENAANYLASTRELEEFTEEGTLIGMTGGGTTAYFIENRTIVNLDGLISSKAYFEAMKNGTAASFLDQLRLDYVYGKPYILFETQPYDEIFNDRLEEIGFIHGIEAFTLYRYTGSR